MIHGKYQKNKTGYIREYSTFIDNIKVISVDNPPVKRLLTGTAQIKSPKKIEKLISLPRSLPSLEKNKVRERFTLQSKQTP